MKLKIVYLKTSELTPYERNARKHERKDINEIKKSIEKYGMNDAIGIWSDKNIIVEGHGRYLACQELGITEVPCVRLDHLTDKERREYAIAHNATAELSEWGEILAEEIADLDLSMFDFDFLCGEAVEEKEKIEETEELGVDNLPESKIYIFSVSAFGIKSECFLGGILSPEESERLLNKLNELTPEDVVSKLRGAINEL